MRPRERELATRLATLLQHHSSTHRALPGVAPPEQRATFVEQLVESVRRVRYIQVLRTLEFSPRRLDPNLPSFDPIRGALLASRAGNLDEAFWLVFLFVHFGQHRRWGWNYARGVYGRLGERPPWNWVHTSRDPVAFRAWLHNAHAQLRAMPGGFGNHRKYQSLDAYSPRGTGAAVESYVQWVAPPRTHHELIETALAREARNPARTFHRLYSSLAEVASFGRTARFDYLCMLYKLGLAPIRPGSAYMKEATGPVKGARLLFSGRTTEPIRVGDLDRWLVELDRDLRVGMQVLEDSLCNWQKSPNRFKAFRG